MVSQWDAGFLCHGTDPLRPMICSPDVQGWPPGLAAGVSLDSWQHRPGTCERLEGVIIRMSSCVAVELHSDGTCSPQPTNY